MNGRERKRKDREKKDGLYKREENELGREERQRQENIKREDLVKNSEETLSSTHEGFEPDLIPGREVSDENIDIDFATDRQCADTLRELRLPFGGRKLRKGKQDLTSKVDAPKKKLLFEGQFPARDFGNQQNIVPQQKFNVEPENQTHQDTGEMETCHEVAGRDKLLLSELSAINSRSETSGTFPKVIPH